MTDLSPAELFDPWNTYIVADLDQNGMGVHLNRCGGCGALVASNDIGTHTSWHNAVNELVESLAEVAGYLRSRG